jgi:uncharacterized protein YegL
MKTIFSIGKVIIILMIVLLPIQSITAQQNEISLFVDWVDAVHFPQASIYLSAWNVNGLPLTNLTPEHFTLREDDGKPFQPDSVQSDNDSPLHVMLVMDISESMLGEPLGDAKAAAARFLDRMQEGQDQVALIAFSGQVSADPLEIDPSREIAFTDQFDPVYNLIEELQVSGSTELYNASTKAARSFEGLPSGHRAVLLLSDGRNTPQEIGDPNQAIEIAQTERIPFLVIGLGNDIDLDYLQRLAYSTGGLFRVAPRSAELRTIFNEMATLLKTQYRINYTSNLQADGKTHQLQIIIQTDSGSAQTELEVGPIPLDMSTSTITEETKKTETSTSTAASIQPITAFASSVTAEIQPVTVIPSLMPTEIQSVTAVPSLMPTDFDTEPKQPWNSIFKSPITWVITAFVLLLVFWIVLRIRRKPNDQEVCAKCGYDLTGIAGACPQCGSTRRLPKHNQKK